MSEVGQKDDLNSNYFKREPTPKVRGVVLTSFQYKPLDYSIFKGHYNVVLYLITHKNENKQVYDISRVIYIQNEENYHAKAIVCFQKINRILSFSRTGICRSCCEPPRDPCKNKRKLFAFLQVRDTARTLDCIF